MFNRIWDRAGLSRPTGGQQPRPYDFRHHFAYANVERWMRRGTDVTAMLPYLADRAVNMHRFPDGVDRPGFWHKEVPPRAPAWQGSPAGLSMTIRWFERWRIAGAGR